MKLAHDFVVDYQKRFAKFAKKLSVALYAIIILMLLTACPKESPVEPGNGAFEYGSSTEYTINSSQQYVMYDSISKGLVIFPKGGNGILKIARITSDKSNSLPSEGIAFSLEYSGTEDFYFGIIRKTETEAILSIYSKPIFSMYDTSSQEFVWISIPPENNIGDTARFQIFNPGESPKIQNFISQKFAKVLSGDRRYFIHYTEELKVNASWKRIGVLEDLSKKIIADIISLLPTNIKDAVSSEVNGRLKIKSFKPGFGTSGYAPWGLMGFKNPFMHPYVVYKTFFVTDYATESTAAHEMGHHISHAILGDDQFNALLAQSKGNHDLGLVQSGRNMVEEWSHFSDYCMNIKIGRTGINKIGYIIEEMNSLFKNKQNEKFKGPLDSYNPRTLDWPSIEGFSTGLFSRLHSKETEIESHTKYGEKNDIPVIGLSYNQLYEILCKKPMNVNDLLKEINNYIKNEEDNKKLTVVMERCGWSYNTKLKILDKSGKPLKNAKVENICKINKDNSFVSDWSISDDNGFVNLARLFPRASVIRVSYNKNGAIYDDIEDFDINIDYTQATNKSVSLNDISVSKTGSNSGASSLQCDNLLLMSGNPATFDFTFRLENNPDATVGGGGVDADFSVPGYPKMTFNIHISNGGAVATGIIIDCKPPKKKQSDDYIAYPSGSATHIKTKWNGFMKDGKYYDNITYTMKEKIISGDKWAPVAFGGCSVDITYYKYISSTGEYEKMGTGKFNYSLLIHFK